MPGRVTAPRRTTPRSSTLDNATAARKLRDMFNGEHRSLKFTRQTPTTTGLSSFTVSGLMGNDRITAGRGFIDQASGMAYLKVSGVKVLPWENIESPFTRWYEVPVTTLKRVRP